MSTGSCEFCKIFKDIYFAKVCKGLPLKENIFTRVPFCKILGFYYKRNRELFYYEGTFSYIPLKILELQLQSQQQLMFQECYSGVFIINLENIFEVCDGV